MLRSLSLIFPVLISLVPSSFAQTSEASCLPYYSWTSNSQNKTPCEVASSLLALCNGGTFDVLPLSDGQHYQGPTMVANANSCICSTVTYSLMTACGLCQGRSVLRWSEWSTNCPSVSFSEFPEPLPADVLVPAWAYQDVREKDMFDQFLAKDTSNATESSAAPIPTATSVDVGRVAADSLETSSSGASESPTATAEASESEEEPKPDIGHANRVGGSVVGTLFGVGLIAGAAALWIKRRRRALRNPLEPEAQTKTAGKAPEHAAAQAEHV